MAENMYLVSVVHMKNKTVIQYFVKGNADDAAKLVNALRYGCYGYRQKHVDCFVLEITDTDVYACCWSHEGASECYAIPDAKRSLDGDLFYLLLFDSDGEGVCISSENTDAKSKIDDALAVLYSERKLAKPKYTLHTVNRISNQGVSLLSNNSEREMIIGYTEYIRCDKCHSFEFPDGLVIVKL